MLALLAGACSSGGNQDSSLAYERESLLLRVGEAVSVPSPDTVGALVVTFAVAPPLPAGLTLDPANGGISGTPATVSASQPYVISATVDDRTISTTMVFAVGGALPTAMASLDAGFAAIEVARFGTAPAKMAIAPDGTAFVTELATGVVRIITTDGTVVATPFATVPVLNGSHLGLLGIATSPNYVSDHHVFAMACTPAAAGKPDRGVIYRWTESSSIGTNQTILLDNLPVAAINNGGAMCFDAQGMLLVSVGDTEDPTLAQNSASHAGKILRIDPIDGSIPPDNPDPTSYVFAKGFRNTFAITMHPEVQQLFAADNGPTGNDELNLILPGRNYEWGAAPSTSFGAQTGAMLRSWPDVVVPTGLAFADPADSAVWPEEYERSLFLSLYDEECVARFEMSGSQRADIDSEHEFLRFAPDGTSNKPLDVQRGPNGQLWVLTFAAIYRVQRIR